MNSRLLEAARRSYLWVMMDETTATAINQLRRLDEELETILTSFDTSYAWNYGSVKEW